MTAIEVGLLTRGSSYSPTPSQPSHGQWPALLVFVPAYSGASVRDLHPLPVSFISIARIAIDSREVSSGAANVKHRVGFPDVSEKFLAPANSLLSHKHLWALSENERNPGAPVQRCAIRDLEASASCLSRVRRESLARFCGEGVIAI